MLDKLYKAQRLGSSLDKFQVNPNFSRSDNRLIVESAILLARSVWFRYEGFEQVRRGELPGTPTCTIPKNPVFMLLVIPHNAENLESKPSNGSKRASLSRIYIRGQSSNRITFPVVLLSHTATESCMSHNAIGRYSAYSQGFPPPLELAITI